MPHISYADPRSLARAATLIENRHPEAAALLAELYPLTGRAVTAGITGPPGAGKSTLVSALVSELRRAGRRVAVIAVDPSSAWTGGAILGDRVRMLDHHADSEVFIRSMATRGHLGGVASATFELAMLLDAAGFDDVLIETVGVGQDEVDIAQLAAVTVVVLVPGMGDDVQALKAGIMEIADVFVINKSDREGADRLEREVRGALSLGAQRDWLPPVVRTVANEGKGIAELVTAIGAAAAALAKPERSVEMWRGRLLQMARERMMARLPDEMVNACAARVARREIDPYRAVDELLS